MAAKPLATEVELAILKIPSIMVRISAADLFRTNGPQAQEFTAACSLPERLRQAHQLMRFCACFSFSLQHRTIIKLFRLRQLRNNRGNLIKYLDPALHLTAVLCALQGFISNEGELRLAVSKILKEGHVVRAVYGLMFYS